MLCSPLCSARKTPTKTKTACLSTSARRFRVGACPKRESLCSHPMPSTYLKIRNAGRSHPSKIWDTLSRVWRPKKFCYTSWMIRTSDYHSMPKKSSWTWSSLGLQISALGDILKSMASQRIVWRNTSPQMQRDLAISSPLTMSHHPNTEWKKKRFRLKSSLMLAETSMKKRYSSKIQTISTSITAEHPSKRRLWEVLSQQRLISTCN